MVSRLGDVASKAWRYMLAMLSRPTRLPWLCWAVLVKRAHIGDLVYLLPHEGWLSSAGIRTVVDAGAHLGEFASAIKSLLPEAMVYSFEPLEDCHERLARRLERMGKGRAFCVALGARQGEATLFRSSFSKSSSLLPMAELHKQAFPWTAGTQATEVPLRRLDDYLEELELRERTLLKIDVQGFELELLQGAERLLERTHYVLVEVSLRPLYEGGAGFHDVCRYLVARGFAYAGSFDQLCSPLDGQILQQDALFVRALDS
jgi:FkbM family methyltransferase